MKKLTGNEIRKLWLQFFKEKDHQIIESASLVPHNDPTLLWINAGVAPLKKYFDGSLIPQNPRMANVQKCIRTNDIDNVGKTARHHTYFEMLGNFSIGDYFRKDAITWGYDLMTNPKWFGFEKDKLYFTVHPSDQESFDLWVSLGVDPNHIVKTDYNYWEIGEGPCGPNTEIFYDRGLVYDPENIGLKLLKDDIENDRYIEVWNIVFSQFNSKPGLKRSEYPELPKKNIDTGMGLERMACVIQGVETNYETDLFMPIINKIAEISKVKYTSQMAFKVIADHVRTVTFAVSDGAMLSNEGRGYVLRRILRRAVRYGRSLGMNEPFMYLLVKSVVDKYSDFYSNLIEKQELVEKVIKLEEEKFLQTLEAGERKLEEMISGMEGNIFSGKDAFTLYDTYGFPFELTKEYLEEIDFGIDEEEFKSEMQKQKQRARDARSNENSMNTQNEEYMNFKEESKFLGYTENKLETEIIEIFSNKYIVLKETPFYAESGGQTFDIGFISNDSFKARVVDTQKLPNGQHIHEVEILSGKIEKNTKVIASIDLERREAIMYNHSVTHLLNQALRDVLGDHVSQQGAYKNEFYMRFDFNNFTLPTNEEILKVENIVNEKINEALNVKIQQLPIDEAKALGARAEFGEKYGDVVRVVSMGDYSIELCGGTHVNNTKEIKRFAIKSIETKGSGVYRIEGLTNNNIEAGLSEILDNFNDAMKPIIEKAYKIIKEAKDNDINLMFNFELNKSIKPSYQAIIDKRDEFNILKSIVKQLEKDFNEELTKKLTSDLDKYFQNIININGTNVIIEVVNDLDNKVLKDITDKALDKIQNGFVSFINIANERITIVAKASNDLLGKIHCGNIIKETTAMLGGKGGGRPDFAQGGGTDISKVDDVVSYIKSLF